MSEPILPRLGRARGVLTLLLLGGSLLTSGCGSLAIGEKRFGCKGHPSDPLCLPASRVYDLTNATDALQPPDWERAPDRESSGELPRRPILAAAKRSRASSGFFGEDEDLFTVAASPVEGPHDDGPRPNEPPLDAPSMVAEDDLLLPRSRDPIPLRVPAQVMRLWLAPWEDENADLHASGYVFTEIAPRTWSLAAGPDRFSNALLKPLQVEQRVVPGGGDTSAPPRRQPTCVGEHCPSATGEPWRSLN
ncbi:TraV family lipoprotein [Thiorhodococcus minor]|uniref:TraV family lipoprotein n=1 Tax=Thiorhodococcus minor TaxID=57489 RepID=A0A6M0K3X2_9GAMM|nr:TraV family lipoprotein [Thiorhodococcus minor]NEV64492.1 TraV family lipoprotein [Thiorhodococcus minor]